MIARVMNIARAVLLETLRARFTPVAALLLLAAVPVLTLLFGPDEGTRAWLARALTTEGLRLVLPLAAIAGGGFLLKPAFKRGWTVLPARRAEYFAGATLAGAVALTLAAAMFAGGGLIANLWMGPDLTETQRAASIQKQRGEGQGREVTKSAVDSAWADPRHGEELVLELQAPPTDTLSGVIEFEIIWTAEAPPRDRSPVNVWLQSNGQRTQLETTVQSRYRVAFSGKWIEGAALVIQPTDPVLIVGTSPDRVRIEQAQVPPAASVLRLLVLSVCAAVLGLVVVLLVRSLSTAPTAVLAGLLLLATLTLLPSLAPAGRMARDRRADLRGEESANALDFGASDFPHLFPPEAYDEFLAARVVPSDTWADAALRLLIALPLLPAGAWLFRLRQIAK